MFQLKYLFTAVLDDGSTYRQTPDDVSLTDPGRSAFYDIKDSKIKKFKLSNEIDSYSVDLTTGAFEVNGKPFSIQLENDILPINLRLIYFRRRRQHFMIPNLQKINSDTTYCIGWQCTIDGKNYQRIIEIN
jgi:hypothetical protein